MSGQKPLFSAQNVACQRNRRILFQNVSFDVAKGDVVHISGKNGSGKTSLLRLMMGALPLFSGALLYEGVDISENALEEMPKQTHFIPANDGYLKTSETVFENIAFWAKVSGYPRTRLDIEEALFILGLHDMIDTPVHYLSQGQRRRLSLSRVLLADKPLWFLDEPANGLDDHAQHILMQMIEKHNLSGGAVVIAGHQKIEGVTEIDLSTDGST